jgi:hypothetical protein
MRCIVAYCHKESPLMPNACRVCARDDRAVIDAALASGEALRAVSRRTGIAKTTLLRHRPHGHSAHEECMPGPPAGAGEDEVRRAVAPWDLGQGRLERLEIEVAQQRARLASVEQRCAALEHRLHSLAGQVERQGDIVTTLQDLCDLLAHNDDAWQALEAMLKTHSLATRRTLYRFIATQVGRPPPAQYGPA